MGMYTSCISQNKFINLCVTAGIHTVKRIKLTTLYLKIDFTLLDDFMTSEETISQIMNKQNKTKNKLP